MRFGWIALALVLAAGLVAALALRPRLPAAERGRRLAERSGCFACHGPEGSRGAANPGRLERRVPDFEGDLMMFVDDPAEIREWIRDGATAKRAGSRTWRQQRERGTLRMPAFGRRLSARQIDDLVAFVEAVSGAPEPPDSLARAGLARAQALGCTGCHGPGGRLARPNPGSFKGCVPSWDGQDFPELVRDRTEFDEWVEWGVSRRFERLLPARFFLDRATLRMPAYGHRVTPGDRDALWACIRWLRAGR